MTAEIQISQLKNVDTSHFEDVLYLPDRPAKVKRILSIVADDLINIYGGDYTTEFRMEICRTRMTISFQKGYPFYFQSSGFDGLVKYLNHEFTISDCVDDNAIHKMLDDNINRKFEVKQFFLDRYSVIKEKQNFYHNLKIVDKLLFEDNTLFKTFSYLDTVYEQDQYKNHSFGHIKANIFTSDAGYYVFLNFGNVVFSISNSGITLKRKVSEQKYDIVSVHNSKKMNMDKVEESFVSCYNNEYGTDYTNARDMVLIHDMMEI